MLLLLGVGCGITAPWTAALRSTCIWRREGGKGKGGDVTHHQWRALTTRVVGWLKYTIENQLKRLAAIMGPKNKLT